MVTCSVKRNFAFLLSYLGFSELLVIAGLVLALDRVYAHPFVLLWSLLMHDCGTPGDSKLPELLNIQSRKESDSLTTPHQQALRPNNAQQFQLESPSLQYNSGTDWPQTDITRASVPTIYCPLLSCDPPTRPLAVTKPHLPLMTTPTSDEGIDH